MMTNEMTSNTISHRAPEFSELSLDDIGFADWSDDVREEIMRIVMATRPELTGDPYTAADVVRDLQEGYLGDVIFSALQKVGALNLIGFGKSIDWPATVEKLRKRIVEETGESMRSVIKRTRGFTKEEVFALIPLPPIPAITDDLRAQHNVAIFHANVRDRACRLYLAADNEDADWTDYIDAAYAQISQRKPALVA